MAVTLEEFKRAFAASGSEDDLKLKDQQVAGALKSLKQTVESLEKSGAEQTGKSALVEIVRRYGQAKKKPGPNQEIAAELDEIHRSALAVSDRLQQGVASWSATGAAPDAGPTQSETSTGTAPDAQGADAAEDQAPDQRKDFRAARQAWVKVRDKAIGDLEVVKQSFCSRYLEDSKQLPVVLDNLNELDEIMDNLSDDLRDVLDAYVGTRLDQRERLEELATEARQVLSSFLDYVRTSDLLAAIDAEESANVTVKAPMESALKKLASTVA